MRLKLSWGVSVQMLLRPQSPTGLRATAGDNPGVAASEYFHGSRWMGMWRLPPLQHAAPGHGRCPQPLNKFTRDTSYKPLTHTPKLLHSSGSSFASLVYQALCRVYLTVAQREDREQLLGSCNLLAFPTLHNGREIPAMYPGSRVSGPEGMESYYPMLHRDV